MSTQPSSVSPWGQPPVDVHEASGYGPPGGGGYGPPGGGYGPPGGAAPMGGSGGPPAWPPPGGPGGYVPPPPAPDQAPFIQFKALAIVVAVAFLLQVIANASTSTLTIFLKDDPEKLLAVAGVVGSVACVCLMLLDALIGLGYAWLYNKNSPVGIGQGAAGGAIGGAITRVLSGGVNMIISLALLPIFYGGSAETMAAGAAGGIIGGVVGVCIWMFVGAALGAVGGVVGGALFGKK